MDEIERYYCRHNLINAQIRAEFAHENAIAALENGELRLAIDWQEEQAHEHEMARQRLARLYGIGEITRKEEEP